MGAELNAKTQGRKDARGVGGLASLCPGDLALSEGFRDTSLGPLPETWKVVRLGDILTQRIRKVRVEPNQRYTRLGVHWYAEGPFRKDEVLGETIRGTTLYTVEPGELIYNRLFAWKGSFGVISNDMAGCYVSGEFPVFEVDRNRTDPWYLWRWLSLPSVWKMAEDRSMGTTRTSRLRFKVDDLFLMHVPLPPLPQQRAIAHALQTVQQAREATERVIAAARELKHSLMRHLFIYGPVPISQIARVELQETEVGPIPAHWRMARLGEIADITSGGTPSRSKPEYWSGEIPWVKTGEINYNLITNTEERITREGLENSSAKIIPRGTLLMAMYGQGVTRGRVAILGIDAALNQACAAILVPEGTIDKRFLFQFFAFRYESIRNLGHGTHQTNLSATLLKKVPILLPGLEEQRTIARILATVDAKIAAEEGRRGALEALFHSLLHHLMTGKIRTQGRKDAKTQSKT